MNRQFVALLGGLAVALSATGCADTGGGTEISARTDRPGKAVPKGRATRNRPTQAATQRPPAPRRSTAAKIAGKATTSLPPGKAKRVAGVAHYYGTTATTRQLIVALRPKHRTRGLMLVRRPLPAVGLDIKFAFASAALTRSARHQLDELGKAIISPQLAAYKFRIEGHTDAAGTAEYNVRLSLLRARAARDYLHKRFGVARHRLEFIGKGEYELIDKSNPTAAINRRVMIINKGR